MNKSHINIAVFLPEAHLRSNIRLFDGVMDYCLQNAKLRAFLVPVYGGRMPDAATMSRVDGVVTLMRPSPVWLEDLWDSGVPVVGCHHSFSKKLPSYSPGNTHSITFGFLKGLGRPSIGFVTHAGQHSEFVLGREHFQNRVRQEGLECHYFDGVRVDPAMHPEHLIAGDNEPELDEFLINLPKPTTLWCVHDEMAALVWCRAERLGLRVPEDIALVGQGDHPCALDATHGISTLSVRGDILGREAAKAVHMHLIGGKKLEPGIIELPAASARIIERASTGGTNPFHRCVQKAWRMLECNPDMGLTVENLIEESGTSRISFYNHFKSAFGISPGKAIRNARTKRAKEFLIGTDMPISQVGHMCGFTNESEFSNFFKRETGKTPKAWRLEAAELGGLPVNGHLLKSRKLPASAAAERTAPHGAARNVAVS